MYKNKFAMVHPTYFNSFFFFFLPALSTSDRLATFFSVVSILIPQTKLNISFHRMNLKAWGENTE